MQRRHDPTYYWATRRLPRDVRPAVHALYGFVRSADEIVDGPDRPADPEARRAALDRLEAELEDGLRRGHSSHPAVAALVDAGARHDLPLGELRTYMRSMRVDCGPVRIASREELDRYMDGSAGTVGRIMAPLLGAPGRSDEFARLGVAFQLTNFIRDVGEDWRLDRLYLPGLAEADVARGVATAGLPGAARRRGGARAGPVRRHARRGGGGGAADAPGDPGGAGGLPAACWTGSRPSTSTCWGPGRGCAPWEVGRAALAGLRDGNGNGNGR